MMGANADAIRELWDAFGRRDLDAVAATVTDDVEIVVPEAVPWGGVHRGPDGFREMIGSVLGNFEEFHPEPQAFLEADDDHVVVPITVRGRTNGGIEFAGLRGLWLYQLRDGQVAHAEVFMNTAAILDALG